MGCTALITGTGSGIGKATADLLLTKNYFVYGFSRTNKINHPNFVHIKIDLTNIHVLKKLSLPKIKTDSILLINNAASIGEINSLNLKSNENIINEYNLNIIAPTLLCKKFIYQYRNIKKLILNISSGAAKNAIASWSIYCASKSALDMLTNVIDKENHFMLDVFSVHPGIVNTNMQKTIRNTNPKFFPEINKFKSYYKNNELENVTMVSKKLYFIIKNTKQFETNIISIRDIHLK